MARRKVVRTIGIIGVCIAAIAILAIAIHIFSGRGSGEEEQEDAYAQVIDFEHVVVDAYFETLTFRENGQEFSYSYRIPKINVTGNTAARMSYAMDDDLKHFLMDAESLSESQAENTGQPECTSINYEWYLHDQTLVSVVTTRIMHGKTDDRDHYAVYNYRLDSAREASPTTVITYKGYSYRQYADKVKDALMSAYLDRFGEKIGKVIAKKDAVSAMSQTICDANVAEAKPFFDSEGNFCIVGNLVLSNGSKSGDYRINLESFKTNDMVASFREDVDRAAEPLNEEFAEQLAALEAAVGVQDTASASEGQEQTAQAQEQTVQETQQQTAQETQTQEQTAQQTQTQTQETVTEEETAKQQETAAEQTAQTTQEETSQSQKKQEKKKKEEKQEEEKEITLSANEALIAAEYAWGHFPGDKAEQEGFYYETYIYVQPTEDNPFYTVMLCVTNYNGSTTIVSQAEVDARTGEVETKDY